ncbi:MAG: cyclic nucleotide-binding domain-containing protein, partial [Prosthecobacter sp.]|nr:cyclic nucleotide-binding domain-containing protein [Prosthecobacter sp.]
LALHMLNPAATPRTAVRLAYHGGEVVARRRLPPAARETLRRHGSRIQILALQGGLIFTTLEPVMRKAQQLADAGCLQLILDLRAVVSVDAVSLRLLGELRSTLTKQGVRLVICQAGKLTPKLIEAGFTESSLFMTEDAALEASEDSLLLEVTGASWRPAGNIPLEDCVLFRSCTEDDIKVLQSELTRRRYEAGQRLITAGEMADEMLVLLEGSVEVQILGENQTRKRVDVLTAGMTVGEMAFLDASPRSADVVALGFVNCLVIPRAWFVALSETRPTLKIALLHELTREISARLRQANVEIGALQRG